MIADSFTILHNVGAGFTDFSFEAKEYGTDEFGLVLDTADYLYVGLYKPFSSPYIAMNTKNANANTLAIEYYDKSAAAFTALTISDETKGMTQSGFIKWDLPVDNSGNNAWEKTTVDGKSLYWARIQPSAMHSAGTKVQGINILFSNDQDLIEERSNIVSKHAPTIGDSPTWLLKHQAARKELVQKLRNAGNRKFRKGNNKSLGFIRLKDITHFDLFDIDQIRQAAKFLVLSKIYLFELSDEAGDKWERYGNDFKSLSDEAMNTFYLSLDLDDDGEEDANEVLANTRVEIVRL